jgi:hypothetical protein
VLAPVLEGHLSMQVVCVDFHFVVSIEHAVTTVERLRDRATCPSQFIGRT